LSTSMMAPLEMPELLREVAAGRTVR